jgi:hypothetical protein
VIIDKSDMTILSCMKLLFLLKSCHFACVKLSQ